jgi:hypothetical protein
VSFDFEHNYGFKNYAYPTPPPHILKEKIKTEKNKKESPRLRWQNKICKVFD